jgi:protein-S-isoprenylcysteine O-methyltransferase Ste14
VTSIVFSRPAVVLEIIWIAWLASWVAASFWTGRTQKEAATLETWTYRAAMIVGGILLVPWTAQFLNERPIWNVGVRGTYLLAVIMLAGLLFTWWARIYLGPLWSSVISRKEDHLIVDTGPYALVRHPIYTGLIVALIATGLAEATVTGLIGAALIILGVWLKAWTEERFLRIELGPEYEAYCRRVPMLVPFLPSRG